MANSKPYYPFRITHWTDHSQSKLASYVISAEDNARYQPGDCAGTVDEHNKRKLHARNNRGHNGILDLDEYFEIHENITVVYSVLDSSNPFADALSELPELYFRQQFDSLSKDFLSQMQIEFNPLKGSFIASLKSSNHSPMMGYCMSAEQKWRSLFGKHWLVKKNDLNDDDCKRCAG